MTKSRHSAGNILTIGSTANTTQYWPITGGIDATSTEANAQQYSHTAGTYSNLSINFENTAGLPITVNLRKNGANANQTLSVSAGGTGFFSDTTNTDAVAVADLFCIQTIPGITTGTFWPMNIGLTFDPTTSTDTVTKLTWGNPALNSTSFNGASTTYYIPVFGQMLASGTAITTETVAQTAVQEIGTIRKLHIKIVGTNNRTTTSTLRLRKNAANGNGVVSVTSGATGVITDSTNTDTLAVGDKINYSYVTGTGTLTHTLAYFGSEYVNTSPNSTVFANSAPNSTAITQAKSVTNYYNIMGYKTGTTTIRYARHKPFAAATFHDISIIIPTNGLSAASTFALQVNDVSSALTVSVSATGTFTDATHSVTIADTDTVNLVLTTGTGSGTNTITLGNMSVFADYPATSSGINATTTPIILLNKFITKI
jgi:hypothetical protein